MDGLAREEVAQATDPAGHARLLVTLPLIRAGEPVWALPCLPPSSVSGKYAVGDTAWVAFENDDPPLPVVMGRVAKAAQLQ